MSDDLEWIKENHEMDKQNGDVDSEHINCAEDFLELITDKYSPDMQNEILHFLKDKLSKIRETKINELTEEVEYLKQVTENLYK